MNEKTEITPLEFEFEAARRALEYLKRKLEDQKSEHAASAVSESIDALARALERADRAIASELRSPSA
jgi:hypothetical protein